MSWHHALDADELPEGAPTAARAAGRDLCLVRLDGEVHAFDDACPHRRWPLHLGRLSGNVLTCRAHTWEWDVCTGELQRMRAPECVQMHAARERDGAIEVSVEADAPPPAELSRLWRRTQASPAGDAR